MDATFDAISAFQIQWNGVAATKSWTHTPSGTPTGALVVLNKQSGEAVTGVTYGGVAMTPLLDDPGSGNARRLFWGLANPSSGAQTVEITAAGTDWTLGGAWSYTFTGSHLTTASAFTSPQTASGGVDAATTTLMLTSQTGDLTVDFIVNSVDPSTDKTMTEGSGQTERGEDYNTPRAENYATSTKPGAASVGMDYSWVDSTNVELWKYNAINVVQAASGATTPRIILARQAVNRAATY